MKIVASTSSRFSSSNTTLAYGIDLFILTYFHTVCIECQYSRAIVFIHFHLLCSVMILAIFIGESVDIN